MDVRVRLMSLYSILTSMFLRSSYVVLVVTQFFGASKRDPLLTTRDNSSPAPSFFITTLQTYLHIFPKAQVAANKNAHNF